MLKISTFYQQTIFCFTGYTITYICSLLSNDYELISDILLMSSITIFVTSSISFYARPFYLISDNLKDALFFEN